MSHWRTTCVTQSGDQAELAEMLAPYDENLQIEQVTTEDGETYWTNPKSKWDWWVIGGRWSGWFLDKKGRERDSGMKGDLDIEAMRTRAVVKAQSKWDEIEELIAGLPKARLWEEVLVEARSDGGDDAITRAREVYRSQDRVVALNVLDYGFSTNEDLLDHQVLGQAHVLERARLSAVVGLGLVTPEGWMAAGEMGWFGMDTSTTESTMEFLVQANKFIDLLPDGAWLWSVDFHV